MFFINSKAIVPKTAVITNAPASPITNVVVVITVCFKILCLSYYQLRAKLYKLL